MSFFAALTIVITFFGFYCLVKPFHHKKESEQLRMYFQGRSIYPYTNIHFSLHNLPLILQYNITLRPFQTTQPILVIDQEAYHRFFIGYECPAKRFLTSYKIGHQTSVQIAERSFLIGADHPRVLDTWSHRLPHVPYLPNLFPNDDCRLEFNFGSQIYYFGLTQAIYAQPEILDGMISHLIDLLQKLHLINAGLLPTD